MADETTNPNAPEPPPAGAPAAPEPARPEPAAAAPAPEPPAPAPEPPAPEPPAPEPPAPERAGLAESLQGAAGGAGQGSSQSQPQGPGPGGAQPAQPAQPGEGGGPTQPAPGGGGPAQPTPAGGAQPPAEGAGGGAPPSEGAGQPPSTVPIDPGETASLQNPQPGAPGLASEPAAPEAGGASPVAGIASTPTESSAGGPAGQGAGALEPVVGPVEVQEEEQAVDFTPDPSRPHQGQTADDERPSEAASVQDEPARPRPQPDPVQDDTPSQPLSMQGAESGASRTGGHHDEHASDDEHASVVAFDTEQLAAFARTMNDVGHELSDLALQAAAAAELPGISAQLRVQVEDRLRPLGHALERLAGELEHDARELEVRTSMLAELEGTEGVTRNQMVSAVFATRVGGVGEGADVDREPGGA